MNNLEHFSMVWLSVGRIFHGLYWSCFQFISIQALMKIETMKHGSSSWMLSLFLVHPCGSWCILGSKGTKVRQEPRGLAGIFSMSKNCSPTDPSGLQGDEQIDVVKSVWFCMASFPRHLNWEGVLHMIVGSTYFLKRYSDIGFLCHHSSQFSPSMFLRFIRISSGAFFFSFQ